MKSCGSIFPYFKFVVSSYLIIIILLHSLRKQPTFCDATNGFPTKWYLRNEPINFILITLHYPDLGSAFDWLKMYFHQSKSPFRSGYKCQSLVWNFCACSSEIILQYWRCEMLAQSVLSLACEHRCISGHRLSPPTLGWTIDFILPDIVNVWTKFSLC